MNAVVLALHPSNLHTLTHTSTLTTASPGSEHSHKHTHVHMHSDTPSTNGSRTPPGHSPPGARAATASTGTDAAHHSPTPHAAAHHSPTPHATAHHSPIHAAARSTPPSVASAHTPEGGQQIPVVPAHTPGGGQQIPVVPVHTPGGGQRILHTQRCGLIDKVFPLSRRRQQKNQESLGEGVAGGEIDAPGGPLRDLARGLSRFGRDTNAQLQRLEMLLRTKGQ